MQIAILGAGMVGRAMAIDLQQKYSVTSFDVSEQSLDILSKKNKLIKTVKTDLSNFENYPTLLQNFDYVICAVPGFMGYNALQAIINAGKNVVDISFFPEDALALDNLAKQKNVTAIVDCERRIGGEGDGSSGQQEERGEFHGVREILGIGGTFPILISEAGAAICLEGHLSEAVGP